MGRRSIFSSVFGTSQLYTGKQQDKDARVVYGYGPGGPEKTPPYGGYGIRGGSEGVRGGVLQGWSLNISN